MNSRAAADRTGERRRAVATATAVALAFLLAVGGVGIVAGSGPIGGDDGATGVPAAGDRPTTLDAAVVATQDSGPPVGESMQEAIDPDSVRLSVRVEDDGTARWRIEYWTELNDDNETAAFEELRDDVAANPDEYTARFANRTNQTVASAENATGREMNAGEFGVDAEIRSIPQEYGVLTYTFTWNGFAAVDGDRLRIGDAVDGFYLDDKTRLVVRWPTEYELVEATPEPDEIREQAVLWRGSQTEFVSGEPRVVVGTGQSTGDGDVGGTNDGPPLLLIGGLLTVLALAGGGLTVLRRGQSDGPDDGNAAGATDDGSAGKTAAADVDATDADATASATDAATEAAANGAGDDSSPAEDGTDEDGETSESDDGPPPELLSNEERVRRLLESRDGRMRQQEVVAETGWTEAKTSQVVGEMRGAGTIETFRLGRENVLKLTDEDGKARL
jgi:hypothetical protein